MRVLLVHCHPRSDSLSAALAAAAEASAAGLNAQASSPR